MKPEIYQKPVFEVESSIQSHPGLIDEGPYRVRLDDSGCTIYIESPHGGARTGWAPGRVEAGFHFSDWEAIKKAVDAAFAEDEVRAIETNRLHRLLNTDGEES